MKVTSSAVYKLTVEADCRCAAVGEYLDLAYNVPLGDIAFNPCPTHKEAPGIDVLATVLKEVVAKEAKERKTPEPAAGAPPAAPARPLHPMSDAAAAARAARTGKAAPGGVAPDSAGPRTLRHVANGTASAPKSTIPEVLPQSAPGVEVRVPLGTNRRPASEGPTPRVASGSGSIKRVVREEVFERGDIPENETDAQDRLEESDGEKDDEFDEEENS